MTNSGLASQAASASHHHNSPAKGREILLFSALFMAFLALWGYSLFGPRDNQFLLCYLIPPLLTFNARRRVTILGVTTVSVLSTVIEYLLIRTPGSGDVQGITAVFSVMLQSLICYLALRQWRILSDEQHKRAQRDAELREISTNLDTLERSQRRLARRNRELAMLNEIASFISRAPSLDEAVSHALDRIQELNSQSTILLLGYEAKAQTYRFLAQRGWGNEDEIEKMAEVDWTQVISELRINQVRGEIVQTAQPRLVRGEKIASYAVFPILDGDRSLGLLLIGGVHGEDDLSFLGAMVNQLAVAIVRDQMNRETRAQAERQLAVERRLMRLLAENAPVAMAQLSPDLKYVMVNPAYLSFMRAQSGDVNLELIGQRWEECVSADVKNTKWHEEVTKYLKHGLPFTAQAQTSRSMDGQVTYWDWTVWPVKDEEGEVESVLLMGTEITASIRARQQLEEALAEAWTERNKLEAVIENITDAVFISDARTRQVVRVNSAAARLLGFEDRQALEARLHQGASRLECAQSDLSPGEELMCLSEDWLIPTAHDGMQRNVYRVWHQQDNTPVQVIVGSAPVRNSSGEVALVVSTAHDVTKLLEIQDELEESNRTKDVFLAMLSHELRTPLTPVLGWVNILRQQLQDEKMLAHGLDVIERNAKLQTQLVDDLLDLSRITLGKVEVKLQPIDLNEIVRRALETVQSSLDEKRLNVELNLSTQPLIVNADARRCEQVIWNLLSNAIKFTDLGGCINIRSQLTGNICRLEVIDTGIGLSADVLKTIFAPFRQADSSITRRHGGLGIGLSIAQSLVELHGGQISAESAGEGHGARFIVTLPADTALRSPLPLRRTSSRFVRLDGLRILLVEDAADTRELLGLLLRSHGGEVMLAESVAEALQIAFQEKPDLILSDIGMPEADGYEFVRQLRSRPEFNSVPIIALTGFAMESDRRRAAEAGFNLHLSKPIDSEMLLSAIHDLRLGTVAPSSVESLVG